MQSHPVSRSLAIVVGSMYMALAAAGCGGPPKPAAPATASASDNASTAAEVQSENARVNAFFEEVFQRNLDRSPTFQTYLGIKKDYGKWDDASEERAQEDQKLRIADLARLRADFDPSKLTGQARLSYRLFEYDTERSIEAFRWRFHNYPVNQMFGQHSQVPAFLINFHRVSEESDAVAYVERLRGVAARFTQLQNDLSKREQMGILPPKFVFAHALRDCRNVITGAPFDESGTDSTILADFRRKVTGLEGVSDGRKAELVDQARAALLESVKPAYVDLIATLERQEKLATADDGAWKLPDGAEFYNQALRRTTTTELTAAEIHAIGLAEVERIHGEMRAIMKEVGFDGTLQEFFVFMREDQRFYYPNTDEGRAQYLAKAVEIIDTMEGRLDELFITKPKARMIVKRVEAFREKSAGKAFYNSPSADGSRPGIYYANLYDMADMPTYQMEALAYHEGIPGHHMQRAISQELGELPMFRRFGGYTAYTEGWGLYSELVPKEMGFYSDPYSDFGRLAMELWRACRLVVDTGIHHEKWTRDQAIDYLVENTPNPRGDSVKAIERYIVMPSQATAYKIGMLKILELREKARERLGDDFDVREFHEVVLTNGAVPLSVLEKLVDAWLDESAR